MFRKKTILDRYREALAYLDNCGTFNETKFREFNRITNNQFSEAEIVNQLRNAQFMMGGMEDLKNVLRSTMIEAISTFEKLEREGVDLSSL